MMPDNDPTPTPYQRETGRNPWLDNVNPEPDKQNLNGDESRSDPDASTVTESVETPPARCRIGHCVEMPHMAFVDWQAPTADGARSGLFTVNLTRPITLAVESHPTDTALRRLNVTCGTEHVAGVDALKSAATALHTDMWDALSAARANYAAHAKRYRKERRESAATPQITDDTAGRASSDEAASTHQRPNATAARAAAEGARHVAPSPESIDTSTKKPPMSERMSPTTKAVLIGLFGYIVLTAAAFGAYSLYTTTNTPSAAISQPTEPPAAPADNGGSTPAPEPQPTGADDRSGDTKWQPE